MSKAAIKKVAQAEIRAAKSFLEKRGIKPEDISPKKFAMKVGEKGQKIFYILISKVIRVFLQPHKN
jgi:1,6-anhydro-N-acetylmuramate kinase